MLIGLVGAPNKGKSTFFSAATMVDAQIANYPFTTISPNKGVTYVRAPCPHAPLGLPGCNPKNSKCIGGTRLVPVNIVDVPGLVPGAHKGKGLGNKFLDSIREADALIQVLDGTGKTDLNGNPCDFSPPIEEARFLKNELAMWIAGIMKRREGKAATQKEAAVALSGLKISEQMIADAARKCGLDISGGMPDEEGIERMARAIVDLRMPLAIACNKADAPGACKNCKELRQALGSGVFIVSAAIELALRKANEKGLIKYTPGDSGFEIAGNPDERQREALEKMRLFLAENGGSGVQQAIDWVVYGLIGGIVVYPVEDEHRLSNHKGEVLPDALLVPRGTTVLQLAERIHTDFAKKFIGAIDAKRKIRVGGDHLLSNGDVIKIIASR
ncbi:MAG: YchF-related putative GTPase [Candidatus Micrarchaeota archaeon]|nr:YchF-related putative GTPase [Candidatus Micrarchaeota archaeon]